MRRLALSIVALAAALCGCGGSEPAKPRLAADYRGAPAVVGGLKEPARVRGDYLELSTAKHGFQPRFWPGVNLGSTVPGRFPGELAQTRADYRRWLPEMAALGTRALRVYTVMPPAFYEELRAYDLAHPAAPIFVIHGVWIPEDRFVATGNAYDPQVQREFKRELSDAVAVVHGDARLPERGGHASGRYRADISPVAAGLVGRRGMGPARGALHRSHQQRGAPVPRALHQHARARDPDGVLDRLTPGLRRLASKPSAAGAGRSRSRTG